MKAVLPAILVALTLSVPAMAADPIRVGDLVIEQAWARATVPSAKAGAVYLTVRNAGAQPERIASITTPVADHPMAHETRQEGEVFPIREIPEERRVWAECVSTCRYRWWRYH